MAETATETRERIFNAWLVLCQWENVAHLFPAYRPRMLDQEARVAAMLEKVGGSCTVYDGRLTIRREQCTMGKPPVLIGVWITAKGIMPSVTRIVSPEHVAGFKFGWLHGASIVGALADAKPNTETKN